MQMQRKKTTRWHPHSQKADVNPPSTQQLNNLRQSQTRFSRPDLEYTPWNGAVSK